MKLTELKSIYESELSNMEHYLVKFPWADPKFYANWCAQTFYYVSHSTRLLALASALTEVKLNNLHYHFIKHLKEESGHENLAKLDCEKLGFGLEAFPELPSTCAFYQTQYYYIQNVHPQAFFGYIIMLEGAASNIGAKCMAKAKAAHGEKAVHFWQTHSDEDPAHIEQAFSWIAKLENPDVYKAIAKNLLQSSHCYEGMLTEICKKPARVNLKVAV
jgi:hypothetical protein